MGIAKQLKGGNFDLAINFRLKSWWISALIYLAGIPRRIGYASSLNTPFLTRTLPERSHEHLSAASLRLLSAGLQSLNYPPLAGPKTPARYPLYFKPTGEQPHWAIHPLSTQWIDPR